MTKILIVDDEKIIRDRMKSLLELEGYEVSVAENGNLGLELFNAERHQIAIVDIKMPGMDGIELLERIKTIEPNTEVFVVTGHGGIETAVSALRKGAYDYVSKPIEFDEISFNIKRALEKQKLRADVDRYVKELEEAHNKLKSLQVQLLQAAKLTAVGELSAGIAHEMNQPLMAISMHMESLMILMDDTSVGNPVVTDGMHKIKDQFARLGKIVKRVHDYSGHHREGFMLGDINRPISDAVYLMGQQTKDHNIILEVDLQTGLKEVHLERYQIQDVVINLLVNARDAVDDRFDQNEGGRIKVISRALSNGKGILAGVIENGVPVKKGVETEIFNPFFTTKPPGKGTGLGLSVCYAIIKDHNGVIGFAPLSNERKIFYFVIPIDKDKILNLDPDLAGDLKKELEPL